MLKIKPEYLSKNGRPEFVVLTVEDYERMKQAMEDADDLRTLRQARRRNAGSPTYTPAQVRRRLKIVHAKPKKAGDLPTVEH